MAKKQGYYDREDESISMRKRKPRTKKQLKDSRDESYGDWGKRGKDWKGKDDNENKGRRSGKGPKAMKVKKRAKSKSPKTIQRKGGGKESIKQERKNLLTENPVVNRSNDSGFDYSKSTKEHKARYKDDDASKTKIAHSNLKHKFTNFLKDSGKNMFKQGAAVKHMMEPLMRRAVMPPSPALKSPTMKAVKSKEPSRDEMHATDFGKRSIDKNPSLGVITDELKKGNISMNQQSSRKKK